MSDPFISLSMGDFSSKTVTLALSELIRRNVLELNDPHIKSLLKPILLGIYLRNLENSDDPGYPLSETFLLIAHNQFSEIRGDYYDITERHDTRVMLIFSEIVNVLKLTCPFIDFTLDDFIDNKVLLDIFEYILSEIGNWICTDRYITFFLDNGHGEKITESEYITKYVNKTYIYEILENFI